MKLVNRRRITIFGFLLLALPLLWAAYNESDSPNGLLKRSRKKPVAKTQQEMNPYWDSLFADYAETIESLMAETGIPGAAVVVVSDSTVLFQRGFGVKTLGSQDSVDAQTLFRIGSVSKCFAAVLTAMLVRDGVLQWDDPVVRYLPDFRLKSPEQTAHLTLRHVLSHTTGLPYHTYTTLIEDGVDLKQMLQSLQDIDVGTVGTTYSYQNVAYSIIGEVIEAATGKSYARLLRERIFAPLGMSAASGTYQEMLAYGNIAHPHLKGRSWREIPVSDKYYNALPAGGINASAEDMGRWMIALLGNRPDVISGQALEEIYTPVVSAGSRNRSYRKIGPIVRNYYGLGWRIIHFPQDTLVYHGGYVNGYRSEVAVYPKDKLAICVLANAPGDVADNAIPLFLELFLSRRDQLNAWENSRKTERLAGKESVAAPPGG